MIPVQVRRLAFALALGVSSVAIAGAATIPSATPAQGTVTNNGVTGTDPVPPGCGCKPIAQPPSTNTVAAPDSTLGAAAQAFLAMLGLA